MPNRFDPSLFTVLARVKKAADAVYVRDQILATFAAARASDVPAQQLSDAKSHDRYAFARTLDSTERIATVVARYAAYRRSYETVNAYYRTLDSVEAADIRAAARQHFTDAGLMVTTLSREPLPADMTRLPRLDSVKPAVAFETAHARPAAPALRLPATASGNGTLRLIVQKSVLPQLNLKLLFTAGSAHDPIGKEGLAALTAAMIARAGSRTMTIDQIDAVLYPMAGSFAGRADKEMTTFTGIIHRDHASMFLATVLPQLLDPGFRDEDFRRVKEAQLNALVQDLRSNNEEELGKERLQTNIFRGTPYGHVALGTVAGLNAITLDDVKQFARRMYTKANLTLGISGDVPDDTVRGLQASLATLPPGPAATPVSVEGRPAVRHRGGDPGEGHARDGDLARVSDRGDARASRFRRAVGRARLARRAPPLVRPAVSAHPRDSRHQLRRLRLHRGVSAGACFSSFPIRTSRGSGSCSKSGSVRSCRSTRT